MIKRHIIADHIIIAHFIDMIAEFHIIKGHAQRLGQTSGLLVNTFFHKQAGPGHAQHIKGQTVPEEIIIRPVIPKLQLMGRAQTDIGDAGMLDGMAARIEKLHTHRPHMGKHGLTHHFFQPVFLDNFYIIIQKHYIFAARQPHAFVAHGGKIKFHRLIHITEPALRRHQGQHEFNALRFFSLLPLSTTMISKLR